MLRKSFANVYGTCYHHESPSDLHDKIPLAFLEGQSVRPTASPRELVEGIKDHLGMFSPKSRAAAARFVKDVKPVMEVLDALTQAAEKGGEIRIDRATERTRSVS